MWASWVFPISVFLCDSRNKSGSYEKNEVAMAFLDFFLVTEQILIHQVRSPTFSKHCTQVLVGRHGRRHEKIPVRGDGMYSFSYDSRRKEINKQKGHDPGGRNTNGSTNFLSFMEEGIQKEQGFGSPGHFRFYNTESS